MLRFILLQVDAFNGQQEARDKFVKYRLLINFASSAA